MTTLVSRDSKGKIRIATIDYSKCDEGYVIHRATGQFGGKITHQPDIVVSVGKAKRTLSEQVELQYRAKIKEYTDKGYKIIDNPLETYSESELNEIVGNEKTDANGFTKHMLAKQSEKVSDATINKVPFWWASRKIDGLRCSFYFKDGVIHTASRGGTDYDVSTSDFRNHPQFIAFFKAHPDYILDGELYKFGKSLQQCSGAVRKQEPNHWLEYYIYDIQSPQIFSERLNVLRSIKSELNLRFDPVREWKPDELRVQMVPQERVSGKNAIIELHDKYVAEGWEGCVVRDPNKPYKFGGRGSEMIKFKQYQDAEFEITGISEGLRDEDMCFTLKTKDGIEFKAKPMGSRELKEQYRKDLNSLIGSMATVKFFYLSDDGTPLQPTLKAIRDYE